MFLSMFENKTRQNMDKNGLEKFLEVEKMLELLERVETDPGFDVKNPYLNDFYGL